MNNLSNEDRINAALNSLNGLERISSNPFLYTRVKAQLDDQKSTWIKLAGIFSRPVFAVIVIAVLISLNVLVVGFEKNRQDNVSTNTELEQDFAAEYATLNYSLMDNQSEK